MGTENNPADMLTRPVEVEHLCNNSMWLSGPDFLRQPTKFWPVSQHSVTDLPDMVCQTLACESNVTEPTAQNEGIQPNLGVIDLQRFSSYNKVLRVTSRVMAAVKAKSFRAIWNEVSSDDMKSAEKL